MQSALSVEFLLLPSLGDDEVPLCTRGDGCGTRLLAILRGLPPTEAAVGDPQLLRIDDESNRRGEEGSLWRGDWEMTPSSW